MYQLLHSKVVKLDLINFEQPEYFDCLSRASREAPWRPNSILNNLIAMFRGLLSLLLMAGLLTTLNWALALLLLAVNIPGSMAATSLCRNPLQFPETANTGSTQIILFQLASDRRQTLKRTKVIRTW